MSDATLNQCIVMSYDLLAAGTSKKWGVGAGLNFCSPCAAQPLRESSDRCMLELLALGRMGPWANITDFGH